MDRRVLLFLFMVSSFWCCYARDLTSNHIGGKHEIVTAVLQLNDKLPEGETQHVEEVGKKENLCTLCEEFTTEALNYLEQNKTQSEIINVLHKSCSKIPSLKKQCIILVDYYAPLFFLEVGEIQADGFCRKVNLCEQGVLLSQHLSENKCDLCHNVVTEALLKLKDPDTELEILEVLLKACKSIGKNVKKCKKIVLEYAPIILINAEQFLEKTDICTVLHACDSEASMHAAS